MPTIVSIPRDLTEATAESAGKGNVVLVQIELPAYDGNPALTLRLATRRFDDADGYEWAGALAEPPSIDQGGRFLETRILPNVADMKLRKLRLGGQAKDETIQDLFVSHEWVGARVWVRQAFTDLSIGSSYPTIFDGEVSERPRVEPGRIEVHAVSDRSWIQDVPSRKLDLVTYPNAPVELSGVPLPIVYGDWQDDFFFQVGAFNRYKHIIGLDQPTYPLVAIEMPAQGGNTQPTFLVADHPMLINSDLPYRYEPSLGRLARVASLATTSAAGVSPATTRPANLYEVAILPIEIDSSTNWDDAKELIRETKRRTVEGYASGDYTAVKRILRLKFPDQAELGTFFGAALYLFYTKNAWTPTLGTWGALNAATVDDVTDLPSAATSPTASDAPQDFVSKNIGPASTLGTGVVNSWADIKNTDLYVELKSAGQVMRAHAVSLVVTYKPAAKVARPGITRRVPWDQASRFSNGRTVPGRGFRATGERTGPDVTEMETNLYAGPSQGYADDGSGTYTGTPDGLIEHPIDVAHHLLRTIGGLSASDVVTTAGEFGSFTDARSLLAGYKMRAHIARANTKLDTLLAQISDQALVWFRRKSTEPGSPFVAIPWDLSLTQNYRAPGDPFTFSRRSKFVQNKSFKPFGTRVSDIVNSLTVNFDFDPRTNTYADALHIRPDGSRVYSGGFTTDGTRATAADDSATLFGLRADTLNLPWIRDPATASAILARSFDLSVNPRLAVEFATFVQAYDLECGHVIQFSPDWDDIVPFTKPGSDGSWENKNLVVVNVQRPSDKPSRYQVEAVELA